MAGKRPSRRRPRLLLDVPGLLLERLQFVRLLDGRSVTAWCVDVLAREVGRLLLERPGWAWARPGAPWWTDPRGGALGAPAGALGGGERLVVLADLGEVLQVEQDPDGDRGAVLVDVLPDPEGPGGVLRRGLVVRWSDVLPWARRRGEPTPAGTPGARAAADRAREGVEREAAGRRRWRKGGQLPRVPGPELLAAPDGSGGLGAAGSTPVEVPPDAV